MTPFYTLALLLLSLLPAMAAAQDARTQVVFTHAVVADKRPDAATAPLARVQLSLFGRLTPATQAAVQELRQCLAQPGVVRFVNDWPAAEGITDVNSDAPPFLLEPGAPLVEYDAPLVEVRFFGDAPIRFRNTMKFALDQTPACAKLQVTFNQWDKDREGLLIERGPGDEKLPPFKGKIQIGGGAKGASLEFSGSKLLSAASSAHVTTLEASGKLPIGKPDDVRNTPSAEKDASKQIPDALNLSLNSARYAAGGRLQRMGLRLRATGTLRGAEAVGYWAPLFGWFDGSRGFYGGEVEAGWRRGDAEFTSLTTRKPDIGHTVARLGGVVEWAPRICLAEGKCINGNLAQGLRFFVRGRGWVDSYKEQGAGTKVRARSYIDSELFYNFSSDARVFLRVESGYLPPDLSTRAKRLYVGVGKAF